MIKLRAMRWVGHEARMGDMADTSFEAFTAVLL